MATHYDTLGVPSTADAAAIRRAYLKRARRLHPDQFAGRPAEERAKAEQLMKQVNGAWTVLGNATKRKVYDADLRLAGVSKAQNVAPPRPRPTGPVVGGTPGTRTAAQNRAAAGKPPRVATLEEMDEGGFGRLVRVGPLAVLLLLFVGIVVVTALLAGNSGDADAPPAVVPLPDDDLVPVGCIDLVPIPERVICGGHQATVWAIVGDDDVCPAEIEERLRVKLEPIYRNGVGGQYCVTRDR